jgi:hypothetical protein
MFTFCSQQDASIIACSTKDYVTVWRLALNGVESCQKIFESRLLDGGKTLSVTHMVLRYEHYDSSKKEYAA